MSNRFLWPVALLWGAAVASGFFWLLNQSFEVGPSGPTPLIWPSNTALRRSASSKTLVMFAHPKCPCSAASLTELENALNSMSERPSTLIAFYEPTGGDASWRDTGVVRQAAKIAGAELVWDRDGRIAETFGANTSGHVVLYDSSGELKFSGGVTVMRGHRGPSRGQRFLVTAQERSAQEGSTQKGSAGEVLTAEVYGCEIRDGKPVCVDAPSKEGGP